MLRKRVIPCLLLKGESLVKTIRFKKFSYIGDPVNTIRIFNELEVDELIFLDISATKEKRPPNIKIINEIADECFMPLTYGGGIRSLDDAKKIFNIGIEKIVVNSYAIETPDFISRLSAHFGNQSIIGGIDIKTNFRGKYEVYTHSGTKRSGINYLDWAVKLQELGAGELFINSIDKDGTWNGYDIDLIKNLTESVDIPVIASGGANSVNDIGKVLQEGGASASAVGSFVIYQSKGMGVLINFPDKKYLEKYVK